MFVRHNHICIIFIMSVPQNQMKFCTNTDIPILILSNTYEILKVRTHCTTQLYSMYDTVRLKVIEL
jgi:hypothetical protein